MVLQRQPASAVVWSSGGQKPRPCLPSKEGRKKSVHESDHTDLSVPPGEVRLGTRRSVAGPLLRSAPRRYPRGKTHVPLAGQRVKAAKEASKDEMKAECAASLRLGGEEGEEEEGGQLSCCCWEQRWGADGGAEWRCTRRTTHWLRPWQSSGTRVLGGGSTTGGDPSSMETGRPNKVCPSDHLPIAATLCNHPAPRGRLFLGILGCNQRQSSLDVGKKKKAKRKPPPALHLDATEAGG